MHNMYNTYMYNMYNTYTYVCTSYVQHGHIWDTHSGLVTTGTLHHSRPRSQADLYDIVTDTTLDKLASLSGRPIRTLCVWGRSWRAESDISDLQGGGKMIQEVVLMSENEDMKVRHCRLIVYNSIYS